MQPFAQLLRTHLEAQSYSQRGFAKVVDRSYVFVNRVAMGKCGPPDDVETWADLLKLTGADRKAFLDEAALAVSHPRTRALVAELRQELKAVRSEAAE